MQENIGDQASSAFRYAYELIALTIMFNIQRYYQYVYILLEYIRTYSAGQYFNIWSILLDNVLYFLISKYGILILNLSRLCVLKVNVIAVYSLDINTIVIL